MENTIKKSIKKYEKLFDKTPISFASPGFNVNNKVLEILDKNEIKVISDFQEDKPKKYGSLKITKNERDYSNKIKEAMKPKNYKKMVNECSRYLKENDWPILVKKYNDVYFSLIKN